MSEEHQSACGKKFEAIKKVLDQLITNDLVHLVQKTDLIIQKMDDNKAETDSEISFLKDSVKWWNVKILFLMWMGALTFTSVLALVALFATRL